MVTAKRFILSKHFKGEPKASDLTLDEEQLPHVADGGRQFQKLLFNIQFFY